MLDYLEKYFCFFVEYVGTTSNMYSSKMSQTSQFLCILSLPGSCLFYLFILDSETWSITEEAMSVVHGIHELEHKEFSLTFKQNH